MAKMAKAPSISRALTAALKVAPVLPADAGLVALARAYAVQMDADPATLAKLSGPYMAVLAELGMTPRSRAASAKGAGGGAASVSNSARAFDELRERRRGHGTADLDPAAP